jgi:hypothetical protein
MIVISAYNNLIYVQSLLNSMRTSIIDEDVLVVCTCPKQTYFIESLSKHLIEANYPFKIQYTVAPSSGYDFGACYWAYQNYKDDYYIFLHDTLVVNHPQWFEKFKSFRHENTLNTWCYFNIFPLATMYSEFFLPKMKEYPVLDNTYPGVFGPIFQISRKALCSIDEKYDLSQFIPSNKDEACAMERGWTYLAVGSGIKVNIIDGHYSTNSQHYRNMLLTKFIINRQ